MSEIIFIKENDNIHKELSYKDIDIRAISDKIDIIGKKVNNNKIGYFQFKLREQYIKICILPKIIDIEDNNKEEKYMNYLKKYFSILNKYKAKDLKDEIRNNYIDIAISDEKIQDIKNFEQLLIFKYLIALDEIENFFKRYNNFIYNYKEYYSYTLRGKINIKKNIYEINKSKVHQYSKEEINYSKIANISIGVLKYFYQKKIKALENADLLKQKVHRVIRLINKNFNISEFNFNINKIISYNVRRNFRNKKMNKLYINLLILLDLEGYFEEEYNATAIKKISNMISITFDPAIIFEYYVYEKEMHNNYGKSEVLFHRLYDDSIKKQYIKYYVEDVEEDVELVHSYDYEINTEPGYSEPDIIVIEGINELKFGIIKDCKWKLLKGMKNLKIEDIEKLKRDCLVRDSSRGVLVYPYVADELKKKIFEYRDENFKDHIWSFRIEECSIFDEITKL